MSTVIGVVTFPGSLDDRDAVRAARLSGATAVRLWHADNDLHGVDAVILPGGFSYGDYLRCGAIARFAPVMESIAEAARGGLPVLGICNGFQILCESHLLPGALIRNDHRKFGCLDQRLVIENNRTAWTSAYPPVHAVEVRSTRSRWSRQTKCRPPLRSSAPGSRPASQRIWKPLQMPSTRPPASAWRFTAATIGDCAAMAPGRR